MDARAITKALGGKWARSHGLARCPCHADKTPSLKVKDDPRKDDGIDLHCFAGCDWKDIKAVLRRSGLLPREFEDHSTLLRTPMLRDVAPKAPEDDSGARADTAQRLWSQAVPIAGTRAEVYFKEHRGLDIGNLEIEHAIRWHAGAEAIIALMTDAVSGKPTGVHRTFLNPDGSKRDRKMLGAQGVVRVSPDEDVTYGLGLTEGIEDAITTITALRWRPVWAATSAGAIERFPVLSGIECLTIFADNDEPGLRAANACAERWSAAGQEALVIAQFE